MVTSIKIAAGAALLILTLVPVAPEWQVGPHGREVVIILQNAYAREDSGFLLQAESAMLSLDRHMTTLTRRAGKDESGARCSFVEAKNTFLEKEQILRQEIRDARESAGATSGKRPEIDTALADLRAAYTQATSCYR